MDVSAGHIWHTLIGHLYCVPIKDLMKRVTLREAFINNIREFLAHIGFYIDGKWGVIPNDFSGSFFGASVYGGVKL